MASIVNDADGTTRIAFTLGESRRAIRLGECAPREAERFKQRLEDLLKVNELGDVPGVELEKWLGGLSEKAHARLAKLGLCTPRLLQRPTMKALLDEFFGNLKVKPGTRVTYLQTRASLEEAFEDGRLLATITALDAEKFLQGLLDQRLAGATIAKRVKTARQIFRAGVKWKMLSTNPFDGVKAGAMTNRDRMHFVGLDVAERVLAACPNHEWRLIFALSRFAGLRCPSEHLSLRWTDVLWDQNKLIVRSTKTEGHAGREFRHVPIFPELLPHLREAFEQAADGEEFVIVRYRLRNVNLRTQLERIIEKAGLKAWPRLFHNLRASRQTELTQCYPAHVVCSWLGNTEAVAMGHYLKVRDSDFQQAAKTATPREAAQIPARLGADSGGLVGTEGKGDFAQVHSGQQDANLVASGAKSEMTPMGFEPMSPP